MAAVYARILDWNRRHARLGLPHHLGVVRLLVREGPSGKSLRHLGFAN